MQSEMHKMKGIIMVKKYLSVAILMGSIFTITPKNNTITIDYSSNMKISNR